MEAMDCYNKIIIQDDYCPGDKNESEEESSDEEIPPGEVTNNSEIDDSFLKSSSITNSSNIDESMSHEDILMNSTWKLNQLAWARMSIYPFWPCMITYDPNSMMAFQKVQILGKSKTLMIHVHFFNDNGRHSWIPSHHMLPFHGIEDFRKRARLITDVIRKKEPKFAAALTVKPTIFGTWQKAVAEAMDVLYDLDKSSLDKFKPRLKEVTNNISKNNAHVTKKRKRKSDETLNSIKKVFKGEESINESSINENASEKSNVNSSDLNLETPPVSPPNEDDLRTAVFQKQKRITKMINKLQPPDFEVYFERNFFTIKEQHSDATDEQVREYLLDVWENMAAEEKIKYRATYKTDNHS